MTSALPRLGRLHASVTVSGACVEPASPSRGWFVSTALALGVVALGCSEPTAPPILPEVIVPTAPEQVATETLPKVKFTEITTESGVTFVHTSAMTGRKLLPETMGSGVAVFDFDNDGDQDLLFINQTFWPEDRHPDQPLPTQCLYANDGTGRFTDVTESAGLAVSVFGQGVAVGDYDNDGYLDVYITTLEGGLLFRNQGNGTFVNVTETAGVGSEGWMSSAAFFDFNNDGFLDLFVCRYLDWNPRDDLEQNFQLAGTGKGRAYGPPTAFKGTLCLLFRNNGDGTLTDVSEAAGVQIKTLDAQVPFGKALGVAPYDIDGDGFVDLAVANDTVPNFLLHNRGDGTFEEIGTLAGVAFDQQGRARGAMGIDWADFRNDGTLGLAIGNFANEMTALYVSDDPSTLQFADLANIFGLGAPTQPPLKFGLFFFDYDLDGRQDLLMTNGHLENEISKVQASETYAQSAQLYWNSGKPGRTLFTLVSSDVIGPDLYEPIVGRGSAYGDFDGDGDLDVVFTASGGPAKLYRNEGGNANRFLRLRLIGGPGSNRDAIGARLELTTTDGVTQRRQHFPAKGYLSSVEFPITFGLGPEASVERLVIRWPSGKVTSYDGSVLEANRVHTLKEADVSPSTSTE